MLFPFHLLQVHLLDNSNGSVDEVITVSDAKGLVDNFYQPNTDLGAEDFYSAEAFLKYGSSLRVVRINSTGLNNANASSGTALLKNNDEYVSTYQDGSQNGTVGNWIAKHAGSLGNSLKVSVCASIRCIFQRCSDYTFRTRISWTNNYLSK